MLGARIGPVFPYEETEALSGFSDVKQGPKSSAWIRFSPWSTFAARYILSKNSSGVCKLGC